MKKAIIFSLALVVQVYGMEERKIENAGKSQSLQDIANILAPKPDKKKKTSSFLLLNNNNYRELYSPTIKRPLKEVGGIASPKTPISRRSNSYNKEDDADKESTELHKVIGQKVFLEELDKRDMYPECRGIKVKIRPKKTSSQEYLN